MTNSKKITAIVLCLLLCLGLCACGSDSDNNSSKVEIIDGGNNEFDDELDSQPDNTDNSQSSGNQGGNTSDVTSEVVSGKNTLTLSLSGWHPGVLGYDATYILTPLLNDEMINADNISYKCNTTGVKFKGNEVTIPSDVRQKGKDVTVTATEKTTGLKVDLKIKCKKWDITFNDDFNGTTLDSSKWSTFEEGSGGTISMQWRDNALVKDGKLNLIVKKEEKTFNGKTVQYTQGGVCTSGKFDQTYGLFTASMKIPKTASLNSAFWLLPGGAYSKAYMTYDKNEPTKGLSEIDIVEASYAWNNTYCIGEHYFDTANGYAHSSKGASYVGINKDLADNYVEYSCAWLEDALYYYADGILLYTDDSITSTGGLKNDKKGLPAYLIFTLGVYGPENTWCGDYSELENATFPITLYVDFARVYK